MTKKIGIGVQDFGTLIRRNCFYVDKTNFIKEWWDRADEVTLIARPRRFGKTLNMNMLDYFFSVNHAKDRELFEGLSIWNSEEYRKIQGTYPVISISFANVKETNYDNTIKRICQIITKLYNDNIFLLDSDILTENEKKFYQVNIYSYGSIGYILYDSDFKIIMEERSHKGDKWTTKCNFSRNSTYYIKFYYGYIL